MCIHPRLVSKESSYFNRLDLHSYGHLSALYSRTKNIVPCGHCMECLKMRQNDVAARSAALCKEYGSMHLVTLTYDDLHLPLASRVVSWSEECISEDTGEIYAEATPFVICTPAFRKNGALHGNEISSKFHQDIIGEFRLREKSDLPIYVSHRQVVDGITVECQYTPSLNRRDVRLWIKRCRVYYERENGHKLQFAYICSGEYGPRTCRPHYHICFYGLTDKQVAYFVSLWKLGSNNNWKRVKARNSDGSNGFDIASRYVSKYVSKGNFECISAKCGDSEKPRLCISRHTIKVNDNVIALYRGYDVFGKYDTDTLILESSGLRLTDSQIKVLFDTVRQRNTFEINGTKYPLPGYLRKKLWYKYDKVTNKFRSCTFRSLYASVVTSQFIDNTYRESREFVSNYKGEDLSIALAAFIEGQNFGISLEEKNRESDFYRFFSKSLF